MKEGGALAMSHLALAGGAMTVAEGACAVALTDCALNFSTEGACTGGGAAAGTSNTSPEVPASAHNAIVYDSTDAWRRTAATVSCDGGRGAGTVVADPTVVRACRADGSWSIANPSCEPCCGDNSGSCPHKCSDYTECGGECYSGCDCSGGECCCGECSAASPGGCCDLAC